MRSSILQLLLFILITTALSCSDSINQEVQVAMEDKHQTPLAYQAPLKGEDTRDRIPGLYLVYLVSGYTLEQHKHEIGVDISDRIDVVRHYPQWIYYRAAFDDSLLATVRADPGVRLVEFDYRPHEADE